MKTIEIERQKFIDAWNCIYTLTLNGIIDSADTKENLALNYEEMEPIVKIVNKTQKEIEEKYFEDIKKTINGIDGKLKEGMSREDYGKEMENYTNGVIEIRFHPIKWDNIKNAKIINALQREIPISAIYKVKLKPFLLEESPKIKEIKNEKDNN